MLPVGSGRHPVRSVPVSSRQEVLVQDRESSVVWGMPGSIANAGRASAVLSPDEIGKLIARGGAAA